MHEKSFVSFRCCVCLISILIKGYLPLVLLLGTLYNPQLCVGWLTSYFCLLSFSLRSNFSASSPISHCHSSLAFSLNTNNHRSWWEHVHQYQKQRYVHRLQCTLWDNVEIDIKPCTAFSYLSLSSLRWSTLRAFLRSARIFFFFSLSVCFLPPLLLSPCVGQIEKIHTVCQCDCNNQILNALWIHPLVQLIDKLNKRNGK